MLGFYLKIQGYSSERESAIDSEIVSDRLTAIKLVCSVDFSPLYLAVQSQHAHSIFVMVITKHDIKARSCKNRPNF
jgi:hypothetical protein